MTARIHALKPKRPPVDDFNPTLFLRAALISLFLWGLIFAGIYWSFHY